MKINCDGALSNSLCQGAVGVIARNATGECMDWLEKMVMGHSVEAKRRGWKSIIIETYSLY